MFLTVNIKHIRSVNGLSQAEFGKKIGCSRDNIASYERGTEPKLEVILEIVNIFHIPLDILINHDLSDYTNHEIVTFQTDHKHKFRDNSSLNSKEPSGVYKLKYDREIDNQLIPLYNVEASAGLVDLFNNSQETTPIDTIKIPNLPKCDGAVFITGDSMYPLLKSGDIVAYKRIDDFKNEIFWGEMYLISIDMSGEEYVSVKYIQKSDKGDAYIKLVSQNQHHQPKDIPLKKVKAVALVKASIRMNSMS